LQVEGKGVRIGTRPSRKKSPRGGEVQTHTVTEATITMGSRWRPCKKKKKKKKERSCQERGKKKVV